MTTMEESTTTRQGTKQKAGELKQPGDITVWKEGRRHRMRASGKIVVDAKVSSVLLGKQIMTTHNSVAAAKAWQSGQRTARYHGEEVDLRRARLTFATVAAEWLTANPAKRRNSFYTDRYNLVGTALRLDKASQAMDASQPAMCSGC
jgi:hypothetical protein